MKDVPREIYAELAQLRVAIDALRWAIDGLMTLKVDKRDSYVDHQCFLGRLERMHEECQKCGDKP